MKVKSESEVAQLCPTLFGTPWPAAHQAPPSMGFSRQEYWSGVCCYSVMSNSLQPHDLHVRLPSLSQSPGVCSMLCAEVQPRLIQGIRKGDGVSDYLFIYSSKIYRIIE